MLMSIQEKLKYDIIYINPYNCEYGIGRVLGRNEDEAKENFLALHNGLDYDCIETVLEAVNTEYRDLPSE